MSYAYYLYFIRATCLSHFVLLDFIALILSGIKTSRRWRFGLWHHAVMWIGTGVSGKIYTPFFREEVTFTLNNGTVFFEISTKPYGVRSQTLVHNRTRSHLFRIHVHVEWRTDHVTQLFVVKYRVSMTSVSSYTSVTHRKLSVCLFS